MHCLSLGLNFRLMLAKNLINSDVTKREPKKKKQGYIPCKKYS